MSYDQKMAEIRNFKCRIGFSRPNRVRKYCPHNYHVTLILCVRHPIYKFILFFSNLVQRWPKNLHRQEKIRND